MPSGSWFRPKSPSAHRSVVERRRAVGDKVVRAVGEAPHVVVAVVAAAVAGPKASSTRTHRPQGWALRGPPDGGKAMGLDSFWRHPIEGTPDLEFNPPLTLCGGMLSGNGQGSFRGKVYEDVIKSITGVSLYQSLPGTHSQRDRPRDELQVRGSLNRVPPKTV